MAPSLELRIGDFCVGTLPCRTFGKKDPGSGAKRVRKIPLSVRDPAVRFAYDVRLHVPLKFGFVAVSEG